MKEQFRQSVDTAWMPPQTEQTGLTCIINDPNGDYLASRFGFYFLPEKRTLRPCDYLAFYRNNEITHIYQITTTQIVTLPESDLLQRVSSIVPVDAYARYQLIGLKYHKALAPIVNDLYDNISRRSIPFTLYQRYAKINNLLSAFFTSELKDPTAPHQDTDFSYITSLKAQALPVPPNEAERLKELQELDIFGTKPEPEFDNLTKLACAICNTASAMIALIGEESNWLKSEIGFGGGQEAARNTSFCQYTIMGNEIVEVPDATLDPRFAGNPYVTGAPNIRFYAAAPLITENGINIGTLCVVDYTPGQLNDFQRSQLRYLANEAVLRIQLRAKNQDLESAINQLESTVTELETTQTHTVELYQNMGDSIRYARRIQEVVLPTESMLQDYLEQAFMIYRPKDIVSGDFYTINEQYKKIFISVGDCTGHGVPGAFMTFIGINAIHKIINERGIAEPAHILERLDEEMTRVLRQEAHSTYNRDGMDIAFCVIDLGRRTVSIAGAQRPVWLVRENEIIEFKGDRFPIAGGYSEDKKFTAVTEKIMPGDNLYLFTDGITDQFGFCDNRIQKYNYRRLRELLMKVRLLPIADQKVAIEKELKDWQQDTPQTDDQLMVGIKF